MKNFLKYLFLFVVGGATYYFVEMLWRGRSHISMFILGGIVFIYAGVQNEFVNDWKYPFWKQVFVVWIFTINAEFITGCIVNVILAWDVWDYSKLPGNILGQITPQYMLLFIPLCAFAIVLDDYVRWIFFGEEKPHYNFKF